MQEVNGWDSLEKSIEGGMTTIVDGYINRGQNTIYFKKFDVIEENGLYWHQYQQNILAAQNEGVKIRQALQESGKMESSYTFVIPLYENMPSEICRKPNAASNPGTITSDLVRVNVNSTISVRESPNGTKISGVLLYKDEIVTRLQKATEKVGGTYWDYIMKADGTKCYVARETYDYDLPEYKLYLVPLTPETPEQPSNIEKAKVDEDSKKVTAIPEATVQDIINLMGENVVIKKPNGEVLTNDKPLGTGDIINDTYKIAVLGDINGDGIVDARDSLRILKYSVGTYELKDEYAIAADLNKDGAKDSRDSLRILKYSVGTFKIEI